MLIRIKKKYQEIQLFSGSHKSIMLFFLLKNVKKPTIVELEKFHAQIS